MGAMPFCKGKDKQYLKLKNIAFLGLKCLSEYSNVRMTFFESKDYKQKYLINFAENMVTMINSEEPNSQISIIMLSNIRIFREVLRVITKFQENFGTPQ